MKKRKKRRATGTLVPILGIQIAVGMCHHPLGIHYYNPLGIQYQDPLGIQIPCGNQNPLGQKR